jgi:DUF1680 family protein
VDNNRHRTALQRGPIIYCIEGIDNGGSAWDVALPRASALTARHEDHLLGGITVIEGEALRIALPNTGDELYSSGPTEAPAPTWLRAIPYYANSNREPTDMTVWIPEC